MNLHGIPVEFKITLQRKDPYIMCLGLVSDFYEILYSRILVYIKDKSYTLVHTDKSGL
jgi:hypothetical protein